MGKSEKKIEAIAKCGTKSEQKWRIKKQLIISNGILH